MCYMSMWYASLIHGVVGTDEQERKGVKREDEGDGKGGEKEVDGKDDVDEQMGEKGPTEGDMCDGEQQLRLMLQQQQPQHFQQQQQFQVSIAETIAAARCHFNRSISEAISEATTAFPEAT